MTIPAGSTSATVLIELLADDLPKLVEVVQAPDSTRQWPCTSGTELSIADSTAGGSHRAAGPQGCREHRHGGARQHGSLRDRLCARNCGFFVSDSEVEESPFFRTTNLWPLQPDGTLVESFSLLNFTDEPTGLAYDSRHGSPVHLR